MRTEETACLVRAALQHDYPTLRNLVAAGQDIDSATQSGTLLLFASALGDTELAKVLIELGANVNARLERSGFTPLIWAAMEGHSDLVTLLLSHGADVNATTDNGPR